MIAMVFLVRPNQRPNRPPLLRKWAFVEVYYLDDALAKAKRHWKDWLAEDTIEEPQLEVRAMTLDDGMDLLYNADGFDLFDFDRTMPRQ